jgi:phytoene desaturase
MARAMSKRRVVVVGAGLGGLSAACHLVGRGHEVVVVERADEPGGRAGRVVRDGFTFDTGPTVLTMPGLLAATVGAAGLDLSDLLTLRRLDPAYRACFADGSTIRVRAVREEMTEEIRAVCGPREAAGFERFCRWLEQLYAIEMPAFVDRNYDNAADLVRPLAPMVRLLRLGALRSLSDQIASFFTDDRLRRLFSFQALYAGMSPRQARAVYAVITYMDCVAGVYAAEGGIGAVPRALANAAEKGGATFHYGVDVSRILQRSGSAGAVRGVRTADGDVIGADAVVVNTDLPIAYRTLLPQLTPPRKHRRLTYSPSAFVWHIGRRGDAPANAAHHNIHFGTDWDEAFQALLRDRTYMPDPSVLVSVPTLSDPSLAPPGGSVLYALEPVPNLHGRVEWSAARDRIRDRLSARLGQWGYLGQDTQEIVTDQIADPTSWARDGMAAGTPFSLAHTFLQSGPFRPRNVDPRVPGLVFVGSGTVPGVGVPMVLVSGRLAAERVEQLS